MTFRLILGNRSGSKGVRSSDSKVWPPCANIYKYSVKWLHYAVFLLVTSLCLASCKQHLELGGS